MLLLRRILFALILLLIIFNLDHIGRFFYPFSHHDLIMRNAKKYNLDSCLMAAVIKTESNFNASALSDQGAIGLMQIMPETGKWAADQIGIQGYSTNKLYDPETNILIGTWYLSSLNGEFGGNMVLVLAAYNGGSGNVRKWLQSEEISGTEKDIALAPYPETRHFIRKVLRNYKIYSLLYGHQENPI
ncbi:MAG TPA: lytic transglycosylase [Desulfotomaculum sp.]|nr:lytic transglycosylase [Desulfotomaculum sp.]HBY04086.1 lytic transglycosylase [Desulfotomaculum sp.]